MPFQKGHKLAKGGRREGSGPPRKAELQAKEDRLTVWQRELEKWDSKIARRFCEQAMKDNTVLLSARKVAIPDAKQEISISGKLQIVEVSTNVDD